MVGSDCDEHLLSELDRAQSSSEWLVYGPFLSGESRDEFETRVAALNGRVTAVGFESQIETLFAGAAGVVCMGGYNTFCEVLSFDKRAIVVPRTEPRQEQLIRARRADELGVIKMMEPDSAAVPHKMADAIEALPKRRKPSEAGCWLPLDGLTKIGEIVEAHLARPARPELRVIAGGG